MDRAKAIGSSGLERYRRSAAGPIRLRVHQLVRPALVFVVSAGCLLGGCGTRSGAVPKPFPTPGASQPERAGPGSLPAPTAPADGYSVSGTALGLRGVPYRNGGSDPSGFDCSGFVQYVYARHGLSLPREVREQFRVGSKVKDAEIAPGDLLFFSTTASGPSHVAIAIGGDQFVHAPSSRGVVRVDRLSSSYWHSRYLATHRLAP